MKEYLDPVWSWKLWTGGINKIKPTTVVESMKRSLLLIAVLILAGSATAQEWTNDMDAALEKASTEDKKVLLLFSGSDWCYPCMRMDKKVWKTEVFQQAAEDHFILVKADFLRRKKNKPSEEIQAHNQQLLEKYNPRGSVPLVIVFDASGKKTRRIRL